MRKLKVYGGETIECGKQFRVVVAAHNMKEVAEIMNCSFYYISHWWIETGNETEIKKALEKPLTKIILEQI